MKKTIGIIFALALVAFLVMGTASAGIFDFLSINEEVKNQTYDFKEFTLDISEDAVVENETTTEDGATIESYRITSSAGDYIVESLSGNIVTSIDEYKFNNLALGGEFQGEYGNWSVFNIESVSTGDNTYYYKYMLVQFDEDHIYQLEGDDLDSLKSLADTFKLKK